MSTFRVTSVEETLRRLYSHRADWLIVEDDEHRWILRKDRLIAFMGMGLITSPIVDVLLERGCPAEDDPLTGSPVLILGDEGFRLVETEADTPVVGVEEERDETLPDWWLVPLPVIAIFRDEIMANHRTLQEFGALLIPPRDIRALEEKGALLVSLGERRLYLSRLERHFYLVEDVSGDVSLAKDIGWWAAVGRALWNRTERRGEILIRRERMADATDNAELLPCRWENELLGYLEIEAPSQEDELDEEDEA